MEKIPVVSVSEARPVLDPHDVAICVADEFEYVEAVAVVEPEPEKEPVTLAEPLVSGRVNP